MVELVVGAHEPEPGPDESPLRSGVVQSRVSDHPGQSLFGGHAEQRDDLLGGKAVTAGRRGQAVANLDAAFARLALEFDPPNGPPVCRAGDAVVAERPLLSALGRGTKEGPHCADVALEREIVRPRVAGARTSSNDPFALWTSMACSCRRDVLP